MTAIIVSTPRKGVALVTLNRPERLNALTFGMFSELHEVCTALEADPEVRAIVLTGAGRGFCAGLDLDDAAKIPAMSAAENHAGQTRWAAAIAVLRSISTPVIAAVNGPAAGAGFGLALAADFRLATPAARFNAAFVRIGLTGGDVGVSWLLPRVVGFGHAHEILLTGNFVDARRAERIGLVNHVTSEEELVPAACALAEDITRNSPFGVRLTKKVLQRNVDAPSLEAAIDLENSYQVLTGRTEDMTEALAAFREKREPRFSGR